MRTRTWFCAAAVFSIALACPAGGGPDGLYVLRDTSTYQQGCFAPCECPIMQEQTLRGTFRLEFLSADPLFAHYAVTNVDWFVPSLGRHLTGSGTYRFGGEVAVQHQLSLDLSTSGGPPTHFDSGLVIASSQLPSLDIAVSIHGMYCFDTVLDLHAQRCPADWDGDGAATPADVASFISVWTTSLAQGSTAADFDGDGTVQPADVASFVGTWFGALDGRC